MTTTIIINSTVILDATDAIGTQLHFASGFLFGFKILFLMMISIAVFFVGARMVIRSMRTEGNE